MSDTIVNRTPSPTLRTLPPHVALDDVLTVLAADGAVIIHRLFDEATVDALQAELAPALELQGPGSRSSDPVWEEFHGPRTRRVTGLVNWSPTFVDLLQHPLLTGWADYALRSVSGSHSLSSGQVIVIGAGEEEQYLHRDQSNWPWFNGLLPDGPEINVNALIALSPFTAANGATRVVPGSHRQDDREAHNPARAVPAEMDRGSVLLFSGRTVHAAGANHTSTARHGLHVSYAAGWLRTEENHQLAVRPHVVATLPRRVRKLLGFEQYDPGPTGGGRLGLVDFEDPALRQPAS